MAENWERVAYEDDVVTKALMTAAGDIFYASGASTPTVLAKGSDGEVLQLASGVPSWAAKYSSSRARAYRASATSQCIPHADDQKVAFDSETYDGDGEFNTRTVTGAADATEANKLHDADAGFESGDVGATVWNITDDTYTTVSAFVDSGELTLADNIMADGESYELYHARWTATTTGYYVVCGSVCYKDMGDGKKFCTRIYRDGNYLVDSIFTTGASQWPSTPVMDVVYVAANSYLELWAYHEHGASRDLYSSSALTYMSIHRLS